MTNDINESRVS